MLRTVRSYRLGDNHARALLRPASQGERGSPESVGHVLRLITRLNVGGPAQQALLLSRELGPRFPTTLVAGTPAAREGEMSDPAVPVRRVTLVRPVRPDADLRAVTAVRQLLVETGTALLHTHMAKAGTVGRLAALTVQPRPRTVHTFHGHVLDGYFNPAVRRTFMEVERRLARHTDVLIAVSPEIRDALLGMGIGRPTQFHVIPLGLDLGRFLTIHGPTGILRRRLGIGDEVPLVGMTGRLVPIKDVTTLLEAMVRLPGVHLAILGDGDLRSELERRTRELRLNGRVHFTGWWGDIPAALSDVDVVALTSRNEGTPVSLIEAGAAARPVVATDVGGVAQVVREGETGYLVAPGDREAVATRLGQLLDDPAARRRMGQAARQYVAPRFGHQRLIAEIRDLYADLIS